MLELFQNLSPETHASLPGALKLIHEMTAAIRKEGGFEACPLFSPSVTGCPFKTLTLKGAPLVGELEAASWARLLEEASAAEPSASSDAAGCPLEDSFSKKLKEGTKEAHRAAENVHFVREFIKGRVARPIYQMMVKDLYHVYRALEDACEACRDEPLFGPMHFPIELARLASLEADMEFYFGAGWRTDPRCEPSAAATAYVERLREVARSSPALLLAHSYTRYLGDLSGGRVLMRVAVKTMGLDEDSGRGTRFYRFEHIPDARAFKKAYRAALDALPISAELASAIVEEANAAFRLNMQLFRHLDERMGLAKVPLGPNQQADPKKCPFVHSATNASGRDLLPGGSAAEAAPRGGMANCPVHLSYYTSRPWLVARLAAVAAAAAAAYWAADAMSALGTEPA